VIEAPRIERICGDGSREIRPVDGLIFPATRGSPYSFPADRDRENNIFTYLWRPYPAIGGNRARWRKEPHGSIRAGRTAPRSTTTGFVFQFPVLFLPLTTLENDVFPGIILGNAPDTTDRARRIFSRAGLEDGGGCLPESLSEELRRVASRVRRSTISISLLPTNRSGFRMRRPSGP
jgi:hypothetical protein